MMGSQKQSHRVRKMMKCFEVAETERLEAIYRKQKTINDLQDQNNRLVRRLRHLESRPAWWKFREFREWRTNT